MKYRNALFPGLVAMALLVGGLLLAGCGSDHSSSNESTISGNVSLAYPLSGASVSFSGPSGDPIPSAAAQTSSLGNFAATPSFLPAEGLRIIVEGGTLNGEPFTGQLAATVIDGATTFQKVDFLTTLAAQYAIYSGGTYQQGLQAIQDYFLVPDYVPVPFLMRHSDVHRTVVDNRLFYEGIQNQGFDIYLEQTVADMLAGKTVTSSSLPVARVAATAETDAEKAGSSVGAGTIFSGATRFLNGLYVGSQADLADKYDGGDRTGWMLKMLASGGNMEGAQLNYMVQKLDVIDDKLTQLTTAFTDFRQQVSAAFAKLGLQLQKAQDRLVAVSEEASVANDIDYIYDNTFGGKFLDKWSQMFDPADNTIETIDDDDLKNDCSSILDFNNGVLSSLDHIHDALINPTGTSDSSILEALAANVIDQIKGHADYPTATNAYQAFAAKFKLYVYWQVCGINLYVEAWHHNRTQPGDAAELERTLATLKGNLAIQAELFLTQTRRIILNSNYATIQQELTGAGEKQILAQAYLLATQIQDQQQLEGSLIALVAARSADPVNGLDFTGATDLSKDAADNDYSPTGILPYMVWGRSANGTTSTLDLDSDYVLHEFRFAGISEPGRYLEPTTGVAADVTFYDSFGETGYWAQPNELAAQSLNQGPWETFEQVSDGGGIYLKVKGKDLWLCLGSDDQLVYFGALTDRSAVTFTNQGETSDDPTLQEVTVQLGGTFLKVTSEQSVVGQGDRTAATSFELIQLDQKNSPNEVALRHQGLDAHGNTLHYYLHPEGGILQGIWVHSLIAERDGYQKELYDDADHHWVAAGTSKSHPYLDDFSPTFTEDLVKGEVYSGFTGKTHSSNYIAWHNFHAQAKTTNSINYVIDNISGGGIPLKMSTKAQWSHFQQDIAREGWGVDFFKVAWTGFSIDFLDPKKTSIWNGGHSEHSTSYDFDVLMTSNHSYVDTVILTAGNTYTLEAQVKAVAGKDINGGVKTVDANDSRQAVDISSKLTTQTIVSLTVTTD